MSSSARLGRLSVGACARERATPRVHVRGRVGDVHGFVASGDAGEDVDLAADFRTDEAGGQADAPLTVAEEGHLREEPTGVRSPVGADEGALVVASPRQAHDVDATAHRPRARAIAADIEDAVGLACGFVAGPGGPRVDADAREGFLLVNVLGCHVGEARARANGCGRDGVDGVGQAQVRESHTGHEARVGDADGGSREVVVAVVVVLDESPTECVVSCARVVVGAMGTFRGESPFEGFAHRFSQERPGDGGGRRESVRVKCGDAWRRPVVGGEDAELFVGEASLRGGVRSGGGGVCCEESASGASVRASGVSASLRDEAVAVVVIVVPSTQQPCSYSTRVTRH